MGRTDPKLHIVVADKDSQYRSRLSDRLNAAAYDSVSQVSNAKEVLENVKKERFGIVITDADIALELGYDEKTGAKLIRDLPKNWRMILLLPIKSRGKEQARFQDKIYGLVQHSDPEPKILTKWGGKEEIEAEHLDRVVSTLNEIAEQLANESKTMVSWTAVLPLFVTFVIVIGGAWTGTLWLYGIGLLGILISMISSLRR